MSPAAIASIINDSETDLLVRTKTAGWWNQDKVSTEPDDDDCPVICADEVFLGSSDRRGLRVVCFALPAIARGRR